MIPFNDLSRETAELRQEIDAAMKRVLDRGYFIMGPECQAFEQAYSSYLGGSDVIGVANGTEAIQIALMALEIGPGDEVICPALTAAPTALAVLAVGATPVFADIDPLTLTLDPICLEACLTERTRAILPVHLYGLPADMSPILAFAEAHGLHVIEDCAQAHGAAINSQKVGTFGSIACFSFYPTKNLGALGDGGAVATRDPDLAVRVRQIRDLGQSGRYRHVRFGLNSRLDELQAAVLRVKLKHLEKHNRARQQRAGWYTEALASAADLIVPWSPVGYSHVYHLYVVRYPRRDDLRRYLEACGIRADVHYPRILPHQPVFAEGRVSLEGTPVAESAAGAIVSLPMFPYLARDEVEAISQAICRFSNS